MSAITINGDLVHYEKLGRGKPVILVHGWIGAWRYWIPLMKQLHLKYSVYTLDLIGFGDSAKNPERDDLRSQVAMLAQFMEQLGIPKAALVGHSLGGMLSKHIVQEMPELVDRVITLGSPFASMVKAHPSVVGIWDKLKNAKNGLVGRNLKPSCATGYCTCGFVRSMIIPQQVEPPQYAVYSRRDGVADWRSCMEDDPADNTEVNCTHIGMVVHPEVYRVVAERLAQTNEADGIATG